MLTVVAAAIQANGTTYHVPRPGRHHDVLRLMREKHGLVGSFLRGQGFLLSDGRFASRKEALIVAKEAGQLIMKTHPEDELFSEDVW